METGTTLRENGLRIIEEIRTISAKMIVNVAAMKFKKARIDELAAALESVKDG